MQTKRALATCLLAALILAGCSSKYRLEREELGHESAWPYYAGQLDGSRSTTGSFNGPLTRAWQHRTNSKPAGPLTIYYDQLVYPGPRKKIECFDLASGDYRGKLKVSGYVNSGLVALDSLGFYALGADRNRVEAVNLLNRKELWRQPVKEAAAGSILMQNSLIVSSDDGWVIAFDPIDGSTRGRFDTESRCQAPPSAGHGLIFQPADNDTLYALTPDSGTVRWTSPISGPVVSAATVGELVIVAGITGTVEAFRPTTGERVWRATVGGPVWSSPTLADTRVVIGHSGGTVLALDAAHGLVLWTTVGDEVITAAPLVVGRYVIAGTMAGTVLVLSLDDGSMLDRTELSGAIATSPVSDGRRVIVATERGYITCFGEPYEQHSSAD